MSLNCPRLYWILSPDDTPLTAPSRMATPLPSLTLRRRLGQGQAVDLGERRLHDWLASRLQIKTLPWAALWLAHHGEPLGAHEQAFLVTPVEMEASMNAMALRQSPLSERDAAFAVWLETLETLLNESGGRLHTVDGATLLILPYSLDVQTLPLHQTLGRDLRDCLPMGRDHKTLRRWMTECQMALHARELPGINGLWFWGESTALTTPLKPPGVREILDPWIEIVSRWHQEDIDIKHLRWDHPTLDQMLKDDLKTHKQLGIVLLNARGEVNEYHLHRRDLLRFWRAPVTIEG